MTEIADRVDEALVDEPAPRRAGGAPRSEVRAGDEAAFVLHAYAYKETSLIVDALTRHHGRVGLVARGAKRPRSALRGLLLAFRPLSMHWLQGRTSRRIASHESGGGLRTLTKVEWTGGLPPLQGEALMSGFYLNELLQKLLARDDPHEALFDAYRDALTALAEDRPPAPALRRFELALLRETGYGMRLEHAADGEAIDPVARYRYLPEQGPLRLDARQVEDARAGGDPDVRGRTLLDLDADDYSDPTTLAEAKLLTRQLLQHQLAGQVLQTRRLVLDLQALEGSGVR